MQHTFTRIIAHFSYKLAAKLRREKRAGEREREREREREIFINGRKKAEWQKSVQAQGIENEWTIYTKRRSLIDREILYH